MKTEYPTERKDKKLMIRVNDADLERIDRLVALDHSSRAAVIRKALAALEEKQAKIEALCAGEMSHA